VSCTALFVALHRQLVSLLTARFGRSDARFLGGRADRGAALPPLDDPPELCVEQPDDVPARGAARRAAARRRLRFLRGRRLRRRRRFLRRRRRRRPGVRRARRRSGGSRAVVVIFVCGGSSPRRLPCRVRCFECSSQPRRLRRRSSPARALRGRFALLRPLSGWLSADCQAGLACSSVIRRLGSTVAEQLALVHVLSLFDRRCA